MAKVTRNNTSGAVQLSPHFFLSELTDSATASRNAIDNTPNPLAVQNLFALAELMEKVRKALGNKVITVNSGYRSPALNKAVKGSKTSQHMTGEACDFVCYSFGTPLQICAAITKADIKFGQLIQEGTWVHISLPNDKHRGDVMTASFNSAGKASYRSGLT
jgi:zinc D-Ala-D-Ala carboxypeptidase